MAAPAIKGLTDFFFVPPTFLGSIANVPIVMMDGKQQATVDGVLREVVVATQADIAQLGIDLSEGVYLVGTGNTGAASAFLCLGAVYFSMMMAGAFGNRVPAATWRPPNWAAETHAEATSNSMITTENVDHAQALRTPQFYLLWTAVLGNAVSGMALLSSAKTVMSDCFGTLMPLVVTAGFASSYVAALSAANATGRLGWAFSSDYLGRKNT